MAENIHVVPRLEGWAVTREGSVRDSSHHDTQHQAIQQAEVTGRREHVEVFIHRENGQIRERNSYGNDPFPPKG